MAADEGPAGANRPRGSGEQASEFAADPGVPVSHGFHGQHPRGGDGLFDQLSANGSELVVFDINQAASFRPLFKPSSWTATSALLPVAQRRYGVTIITNASEHSFSTVAKITPAGSTRETVVPLAQAWPQDVYSLSHVAVPFPPDDDLYGREPRVKNRYGISLGTIALWGETSVLSVGKEALMRSPRTRFTTIYRRGSTAELATGKSNVPLWCEYVRSH